MNDLDQLLGLYREAQESFIAEQKFDSLKKEIQGLIEKGESLINAHDDVFELGERKYWDIRKFGNAFKVETRMEYDKLHCEKIINLIIHAFQMNLDSDLEQQNKALTEQVKQLQDRLENELILLNNINVELASERDQLKSKIEKIQSFLTIWQDGDPENENPKKILDIIDEILGENDKK